MAYIRLRKHYLHLPYLILGLLEFVLLLITPFLVEFLQELFVDYFVYRLSATPFKAIVFAIIMSCGTLAMGVYSTLIREGFSSMFFRTLVAFCFVGALGYSFLQILFPNVLSLGTSNLFWTVLMAMLLVSFVRGLFTRIFDIEQLTRRVVIYGAGQNAQRLLEDCVSNQRELGIRIVGCIPDSDSPIVSTPHLMEQPDDWFSTLKQQRISEVVVAPQERRRGEGSSFPLKELTELKLRGIEVSNAEHFYERELKKAKLNLIHHSWILFSDGFKFSKRRDWGKRLFDLAICSLLLLIASPFILLTAMAVYLQDRGPVLYSQIRVGAYGKPFRIYKFRSMRIDAEKHGAQWASKNDNRITPVGAFIRNTRLDELPQLWNVFRGDMSFVGPRPERPEFVKDLEQQIPFYDVRHYVKPGLMGWAQLKYPYGASVEDARGKLEYDLYYTKNHSFLMDILILIQTVEVVLLGKGVH